MQKKKGISLIVLIITIVVMIILSTAIILALNDNGIMNRTNEMKKDVDESSLREVATVLYAEYDLESKTGVVDKNANDYVKDSLKKQGYNEDLLDRIYVWDTGKVDIYKYPKIPKGFVISPYEGENKISEGLVIYELEEGEKNIPEFEEQITSQENRNQFVWVPVPDINDFVLKEGHYEGTMQTEVISGYVSEPYSLLTSDSTREIAEYKAMKESVEKYGGFYIARYEAGKRSDKVVSKKGAPVWTEITWGVEMEEVGTEGAVAISREMYDENDLFVSHLIYGVQWDATVSFISKTDMEYAKGNTPNKGWNRTNVGGGLKDAGTDVDASASNMINNIYDMAGNASEWTMEAYGFDGDRTIRGTSCSHTSVNPSTRNSYLVYNVDYSLGFRIALYIMI